MLGWMSLWGYIINAKSADPIKPPHARPDKKCVSRIETASRLNFQPENPSMTFLYDEHNAGLWAS